VSVVHAVLPAGVDDPARPSGGNVYDRRVCAGLAALGWTVLETAVPGPWPAVDATACSQLADVLGTVPARGVVLVDGIIASAVPHVLAPHARRLRLVVLVHLPLTEQAITRGRERGDGVHEREGAALAAATAVVTTSAWTRQRLLDLFPLEPHRIHVAEPGVDAAATTRASEDGGRLLCVAAVSRHKGQRVLVSALATLRSLGWTCAVVGSLEREPEFVDALRRTLDTLDLADRVQLLGPRTGAALDHAYADADLLVLPSYGETYGMVVTEALARGLPVVASDVGGMPDALGHATDRRRPGILVPPGDAAALSDALRSWLVDDALRSRLRDAALDRRRTLLPWSSTSATIATVLAAA
jgi:glycosyltransferase involved in cell wall biosynthesis